MYAAVRRRRLPQSISESRSRRALTLKERRSADCRNRGRRPCYRGRYNDKQGFGIRKGLLSENNESIRTMELQARRRVADMPYAFRGSDRYQFLRRQGGESGAPEPESPDKLQYQDESWLRSFPNVLKKWVNDIKVSYF